MKPILDKSQVNHLQFPTEEASLEGTLANTKEIRKNVQEKTLSKAKHCWSCHVRLRDDYFEEDSTRHITISKLQVQSKTFQSHWWGSLCAFLSNESALIARHFLKQRIFTTTLAEVTCACRLCEYRNVSGRHKNVHTGKSKRVPE